MFYDVSLSLLKPNCLVRSLVSDDNPILLRSYRPSTVARVSYSEFSLTSASECEVPLSFFLSLRRHSLHCDALFLLPQLSQVFAVHVSHELLFPFFV